MYPGPVSLSLSAGLNAVMANYQNEISNCDYKYGAFGEKSRSKFGQTETPDRQDRQNVSHQIKESSYDRVILKNNKPKGKVILILGNSAKISDLDSEDALRTIDSIKSTYPETRIIYLGKNENDYRKFIKSRFEQDVVIKLDSEMRFLDDLKSKIKNVPSGILNPYCQNSKSSVEDYLVPKIERVYEVHGGYVAHMNVLVKVGISNN